MPARAVPIILATWLSIGIAAAQETVTFPAIDTPGAPPTVLSGLLYRPAGPGPFPAVIGLHGCGGVLLNGKPAPLLAQWGELLAAEGYIVLMPDSHSSRGHPHRLCELVGDARPVQWNRERSRDAYAGLRYLKTRSDVQPNSIVVMGQSAGAAPILHLLSTEVGQADWKGRDEFRATVLFYPACQLALDALPDWKPRLPSLLLMGEADDWTPAAPCKQLFPASTSGHVESHYYPDAYHAFDHPNMPKTTVTSVKLPPNGHSPTIATDPTARNDAIARVKRFLATKTGGG
jgi:dienelactone hydrolase